MNRLQLNPNAVRAWAEPLLRRAYTTGPIPTLGSPEWAALQDSDPRKPAAAVLLALAAIAEVTPAAIAAKLDAEDREAAQRVKDAATDLSTARRWATGPTFRELDRRRNTYATPALTPEQIRAGATVPWTCDQPQEQVA